MITYHEAVPAPNAKTMEVFFDMVDLTDEAVMGLPEETRRATIAEAAVLSRIKAAIATAACILVNNVGGARSPVAMAELDRFLELVQQAVHMAASLGKGFVPLEDLDNVPEWVVEDD